MVLDDIVAHAGYEVARRRRLRPEAEIRDGLTASRRSLEQALRRPHTGFVMECKRVSPSRGTIRPDYDPVELARRYAPLADAISVLTEERFFGGSLEHLRAVSESVSVPVLSKGFVVDPYQVFEARAHGADAVLLLLSVLDDDVFHRCAGAAAALGMDVLAEVHDEVELGRALALDARIIGINNRNLATLEVDLAVTERLSRLVPDDRVVVAESGLACHRDALRLRPLVDAFLVGTALSSRTDVARACRELVFGSVKVCGLTRPDDAEAAADAGAVFGGLVFAAGSPRRIDRARAREVRRAQGLSWVGVFVDAPERDVALTADELGLCAVQLHGGEPAGYVYRLRQLLPHDCEIWRARPVGARPPDVRANGTDRLVLDTRVSGMHGGTGQRFDWSLLEGVDLSRALLAGGLEPGCAAAADRVGAFGLDLSSGIERSPGRKSRRKLAEFFGELRGRGRARS